MKTLRSLLMLSLVVLVGGNAWAANYDAQDYDLYAGDFNGDGLTDLLYIAKLPGKASGIALATSTAPPSVSATPWQSWPSDYLGIQWSGSAYNVIVADFNHDGKSDLLLQSKTPGGTSYLLLAQAQGQFTTISQPLINGTAGVNWTADQSAIVAGDFNGDGCADVFLQATKPSGSDAMIVLTNCSGTAASGTFTATGPAQTWGDGFLGFKWSTINAIVYAGDFNGDHLADLLVQQKPTWVTIDYDVPFPVPSYTANGNGIAFSAGAYPFFGGASQPWSRMSNGGDWSPLTNNLVVADFNGDGCADVLLQARNSSHSSYLLPASACHSTGIVFPPATSAATISSNVAISGDVARIIAGHYGTGAGAGLYVQAVSPAGTNYFAGTVTSGGTITASAHDLTYTSAPQAPLPATAPGRTPGSEAVLPDGNSAYSVALKLPPGTAGLSPSLSLNYHSSGRDGVLGVGWSLGGFSAIARCRSTVAQDGIDAGVSLLATDQYCLEGARLRLYPGSQQGADGSVYGTEIEQFSQIVAHGSTGNGPSWFEVRRADGLIYEYGNSSDSQIPATGTSIPRTWALNKIRDRRSNYATFSYYNDTANGSYRPYQVKYAGNTNQGTTPSYTVTFVYELRQTSGPSYDPVLSYFAGYPIREVNQLKQVTVANGAATIRNYNIIYGAGIPKTLTSIQECSGDGSSCLAPSSFGWQMSDIGVQSTPTNSTANTNAAHAVFLDLDGDGITDALWSEPPNYDRACYALGTGQGFGPKTCSATIPFTYNNTAPTPWVLTVQQRVMDFKGDGRQELLQFNASSANNWELLYLDPTTNQLAEQVLSFPDLSGAIALGVTDIDGDGRDDLVYFVTADSNGNPVVPFGIWARLSTGKTFLAPQQVWRFPGVPGQSPTPCIILRAGDFNQDGRDDLFVAMGYGSNCQPQGSQSPWDVFQVGGSGGSLGLTQVGTVPIITPYDYPPLIGDFNGDGIPDVAYASYSGSNAVWSVMFGTGSSSAPLTSAISTNVSSTTPGQVFVADWDSDHRSDLVFLNDSSWSVARSQGDPNAPGGLFQAAVPTSVGSPATPFFAIDALGRGLLDFVSVPSSSAGPISIWPSWGPYDGLMTTAADGNNNSVGFTYQPLTTSGLYKKGKLAIFPSYDYEGSRQAVASEQLSDGIGGNYQLSYFYQSAQVDRQGRGFLGFGQTNITDSRNGFVEQRYTQLSFPETGLILQDDVLQGDGTLVSHTMNTPTHQTVSSTTNEQRYFPYVGQSTTTSYEVGDIKNGKPITTVTRSVSFDGYGNVLTQSEALQDTDSTAPVSPSNGQSWTVSIANTPDVDPAGSVNSADVATWCVSLNDKRVVSYTATDGSAPVTRTTQYIPDTDPTQCRIAHVITEPSDPTYKVTQDYGFDGFGNVNSSTVTGVAMSSSPASRTTSTSWTANGQFPWLVTNAMYPSTNPLAQTTQLTFDPNFGGVTKIVDPNGISMQWHYDALGRLDTETRPDNTRTTWTYALCYSGNPGDSRPGCVNNNNVTRVTQVDLNLDGSVEDDANIYLDTLDRVLVKGAMTFSGAYDRNEVQYDNFGRIHQESAPCFWSGCAPLWTVYTYDNLSRPTQIQRTVVGVQQNTYLKYQGRSTPIQDGNGHTTTLVHDVNGWLRQTQDAAGYTVQLGYDAAGSKTSTTDSLGNTLWQSVSTTAGGITYPSGYAYGIQPFLLKSTDLDSGTSTYAVDALGELTGWTDAKGQSSSANYDALSRLTDRLEPSNALEPNTYTHWTWGTVAANAEIGSLKGVCMGPTAASIAQASCNTNQYYNETEAYDGAGRLRQRSIFIPGAGTFGYGWNFDNNTGLLATATYPATVNSPLQLQYGYANGVLQSIQDVTDNVAVWQANSVNAAGQVTRETAGNVIVTSRQFDPVTGWLTSVQAGVGGGAGLQNQGFYYDAVGNLIQRQDNNLGLTENLYPDVVDRLDHTTGPSPLQMHYDSMGNISSRSDIANNATWSYDPVHKHQVLTAGDSSHTYTYDANGNALTRNGSAISWSTYNSPLSISAGAGSTAETLTFSYGPDRQRWQQVYTGNGTTETTDYIGDALEQLSVSGTVTDYRHYIYGPSGAIAVVSKKPGGGTTFNYFLGDHQASVAAIVGSSGTPLVRESFAPFGARRNPNTWSGPPFSGDLTTAAGVTRQGYTFQTQLGLWTGLNHMNGRVQDAVTGRFLSPDPFITDSTNTQDYNRYAYVDNNPSTLVDPSGFDDEPPDDPCPVCRLVLVPVRVNPDGSLSSSGVDNSAPPAEALPSIEDMLSTTDFGLGSPSSPGSGATGPGSTGGIDWTGANSALANTLPSSGNGPDSNSFKPAVSFFDPRTTVALNRAAAIGEFVGGLSTPLEIPIPLVGGLSKVLPKATQWLGFAGRAEAAAARGAAKPFAMGLERGLDAFAEARGATTWKSLADLVNWKSGVLDKLADPSTMVHFNLDGVDVWRGLSRAAAGRGGATDWELLQIRSNPQWWDSLQFWKDGSPVANPFAR